MMVMGDFNSRIFLRFCICTAGFEWDDYIFTKNINVYEYKHIDEKLKNGNWPRP